MDKTKVKNYESPVVEIIEVSVEQGFAGSKTVSGWDNEGSFEDSFIL